MRPSTQRGFTLIELMVVVAVLFVIVSFAIPAYRDYVRTARLETMMGKIEQFRMFEDNYRIDNGTYLAGHYEPSGTYAFIPDLPGTDLGYRLPGDKDGVSFVVSAGACGSIQNCYKVEVQSSEGDTGTYESQNGGTWTW